MVTSPAPHAASAIPAVTRAASQSVSCIGFPEIGTGPEGVQYHGKWNCDTSMQLTAQAQLYMNNTLVDTATPCNTMAQGCSTGTDVVNDGPGNYKAVFNGKAVAPAGSVFTSAPSGCTIDNQGSVLDCVSSITVAYTG